MEAISLSILSLPTKPKPNIPQNRNKISRSSTSVVASMRRGSSSYNDRDFDGGRLVDENMIVLRKRIHEMKMIEKSYQPPSDWMEWEKRWWYTSYDSFICEVMGMLQSQLMNTRPSLALGMLALIVLSLPVFTSTILFHLIEMSKGVLSSI